MLNGRPRKCHNQMKHPTQTMRQEKEATLLLSKRERERERERERDAFQAYRTHVLTVYCYSRFVCHLRLLGGVIGVVYFCSRTFHFIMLYTCRNLFCCFSCIILNG